MMNARAIDNLVLLKADGLQLLLPQSDVSEARHLSGRLRAGNEPGVFLVDDGDDTHAVVAPSARLRPLADPPADRFVLVQLAGGRETVSVLWSDIRVLIGVSLPRQPLPEALRAPGAPVDAWVRLPDRTLALCTTGPRLAAHLMPFGD